MGKNNYAEELELVNRFREEAPVDVENLALALGVRVEGWSMPLSMSGQLSFDADSDRYTIAYNKDQPMTRQRFTIAHELGHYMLHRQIVGDGVNDTRAYRTDDDSKYYNARIKPHHETEANRFAANVLMPTDLILAMKKSALTNVTEMAAKLKVSKAALEIRLSDLDRFRKLENEMMNGGDDL